MRTRTLHLTLAAALMLGVVAPTTARAELPHEKLHRALFGSDRDRDDDRKKKKKKDKDDYDDRRYSRHSCYDHNHNGYCDVCGARYSVVRTQPVIRVVPQIRYESYDRYDRQPIEVDVQIALRREGYYRGPIDGDIGPGSRYAIRAYQYDNDLPVTGRIDGYLLRSLGLR